MATSPWRIAIDTGGTFTDCLAVDPVGRTHRAKVLSTSALRGAIESVVDPATLVISESWGATPALVRGLRFALLAGDAISHRVSDYDAGRRRLTLDTPLDPPPDPGALFELQAPFPAPLLAARLVTGTGAGDPLPAIEMRLATTIATNALLEKKGARVALFVTRGFADLLLIGTQQRPDLFVLDIVRPAPLYESVVEVDERLAAGGDVLAPLTTGGLEGRIRALLDAGIRDAAVSLLHSYANPAHEQALASLLRARGFARVHLSSELAPFQKVLPRAETAVIEAYLAPAVAAHFGAVRRSLGAGSLHAMNSAGGLTEARGLRAKDALLSGPAGGIQGAVLAARRSGFHRLLAFDMGGTSTDVARFDGEFEYRFEHQVGAAHVVSPALAIETVAAGGGSILHFDGHDLKVGPESAGAVPGPACYGGGGPLTVTDANLLLNRLDPARFGIPILRAAAGEAYRRLHLALRTGRGERAEPEPLLEGLLDLVNERMADAIRKVSLGRGYDPRDHVLVAFGGAGGQHAVALAERLGIATVLVPADAGLLSSLGVAGAPLERFAERQVLRPLDDFEAGLPEAMAGLGRAACAAVVADGGAPPVAVRLRLASLRLQGQETAIDVAWRPGLDLRLAFAERHQVIYGYAPGGRAVEVVSLRVVASTAVPEPAAAGAPPKRLAAVPARHVRAWLRGGWCDAAAFDRAALAPGATLAGPALVFEAHGATVVEPGWEATVDGASALVLRREARGPETRSTRSPSSTPVRLELFTHRLRAIAEEMGEMLRKTAVSTNIKERLDFSCAILDADAELVVNAPHIPVHLGSLGMCVQAVRARLPLRPGDAVVTNHPACGGSHLPDVTVVSAVHGVGGALLGYVASRAHHAEIGGVRPGSMPPDATTLAAEGVVLPPAYLVEGGRSCEAEVRRRLLESPYPTRAIADNLADLAAQAAANRHGEAALLALAAERGEAEVKAAMAALKAHAEQRVRAAFARLPPGRYAAGDRLDDGTPLAVTIDLAPDGATVDFAGTGPVHPGNLNATPAVVRAVVIYVVRLLVAEALPLNDGLMHAVSLRIPKGSLLDPDFSTAAEHAPAVVGGNVETSQRLVDTLLLALAPLGLAAASQGTMNNVVFGNARYGYYETVCGGAGAGPGFDGACAVHTHMTNTRITDVEVLEHRYPVRIERFALRPGSGGAGRRRGGDGVIREYVFLEPASLSLLAERRREGPYGLAGGEPGARGAQRVIRASGEVVALAGRDTCEVESGDRLVLETPGGGGFGTPET